MTTNRPIRSVISILFLMFVFSAAAFERPAYAQCEDVTDAKIVNDILAKIRGDKSLYAQLGHINVQSTNFAVKFQGWTDTKRDYDRVVGFAEMACVRVINVNAFTSSPPPAESTLRGGAGGCAAGTKPCGDLCIPEADSCNISGATKSN